MPDVASAGVQKADQYRLGLIAYEMLVGSKRFQELGEALRQLVAPESWEWPELTTERKECPHHICGVVDRMVKTNPLDRYRSIDDVETAVNDTDLDVETVRDSYRRLMEAEDTQTAFFHSFYVQFLNRYPRTLEFFDPKRFGCLAESCKAKEAWQRQFQALKEAVLLLIVFKIFREEGREPNILTRIAEEHAKRIPAGLYPCFGEVLVDVVLEEDRQAPLKGDALRRAWTGVIQPGIDYMKRKREEVEARSYRGDSSHASDNDAAVPKAARRRKFGRI
jgi:hypothetical protein